MMKWMGLCIAPAIIVLTGCVTSVGRPSGSELELHWGVLTNLDAGRCQSELSLVNHGSSLLPQRGWTLYFNFERPVIPDSVTSTVAIERINGDFYRMRPSKGRYWTSWLIFRISSILI